MLDYLSPFLLSLAMGFFSAALTQKVLGAYIIRIIDEETPIWSRSVQVPVIFIVGFAIFIGILTIHLWVNASSRRTVRYAGICLFGFVCGYLSLITPNPDPKQMTFVASGCLYLSMYYSLLDHTAFLADKSKIERRIRFAGFIQVIATISLILTISSCINTRFAKQIYGSELFDQPILYMVLASAYVNYIIYGYKKALQFYLNYIRNHEAKRDFDGPFLLLLRSFNTKIHYVYRHPVEDKGPNLVYDLIANIELSLRGKYQLVAIGGELQLHDDHEMLIFDCDAQTWLSSAQLLAMNSKAIILIPEISEGITTEIQLVKELGLLSKTAIIMAPTYTDPLLPLETMFPTFNSRATRWEEIRRALWDFDIHLPSYNPKGSVFMLEGGSWVAKCYRLEGDESVEALSVALGYVLETINSNWLPLKDTYPLVRSEVRPLKVKGFLLFDAPGYKDDNYELLVTLPLAGPGLYCVVRVLSLFIS